MEISLLFFIPRFVIFHSLSSRSKVKVLLCVQTAIQRGETQYSIRRNWKTSSRSLLIIFMRQRVLRSHFSASGVMRTGEKGMLFFKIKITTFASTNSVTTERLKRTEKRHHSSHIFLKAHETKRNKNIIKFQSNLPRSSIFLKLLINTLLDLYEYGSEMEMEKRFWFNNRLYCCWKYFQNISALKKFIFGFGCYSGGVITDFFSGTLGLKLFWEVLSGNDQLLSKTFCASHAAYVQQPPSDPTNLYSYEAFPYFCRAEVLFICLQWIVEWNKRKKSRNFSRSISSESEKWCFHTQDVVFYDAWCVGNRFNVRKSFTKPSKKLFEQKLLRFSRKVEFICL